jgi:hypothetical protein
MLLLRNYPKLVLGDHRFKVAMFLFDGEGFQVPLLRGIQVALLLNDPPQLVIGSGYTNPVIMGGAMVRQLLI